ncbi:DUF1697 domain-containing protein [Herbiconiux ginsengi]|uniref:Uncharacterized conserved protein, DUF1697 family n=1 Tax=Herbiconiux ginsengi TaxID=381665 RepID=A0A1H3KV77_9MICO|nr:DUF1697 domain-containing protein [Herbiconiux ginsengi]SDY55879.1 Uncharacterized conserved protein, DUF1697 family [Herbiconiux ginsengi]
MTRFAALLRGVNVGGITITSADLAELFRSLGFDGVKTVLASGNVLFDTDAPGGSPADVAALKTTIEAGLRKRFGYEAWIVLIEHADLAGIVDGFPYDEVDDMQPYVVFSSDPAVTAELGEFIKSLDPSANPPERAQRSDNRIVYWEVPKGHSLDTALAKFLAKPKFKAATTTRNLRTLRKLL